MSFKETRETYYEYFNTWGPIWVSLPERFIAPENLEIPGWSIVLLDEDPSYEVFVRELRKGRLPAPSKTRIYNWDYFEWLCGIAPLFSYEPFSDLIRQVVKEDDIRPLATVLDYGICLERGDLKLYGREFMFHPETFFDENTVEEFDLEKVKKIQFTPDGASHYFYVEL